MKRKRIEEEKEAIFGSELSFAATEAYKLLRTNLLFSLPNSKCKAVGVTSSLPAEGKTTTAINLAYVLAQAGKKVLLMECDMRIPSFGKKLNCRQSPGLSNALAGLQVAKECIQTSDLIENLHIVASGDIPPNPSELLGSQQMEALVTALSAFYDYIIMDLPPISAVSDALVLSRLLGGMIVVVRKEYCTRSALRETMSMIEFLKIKVLGFVMTRATSVGKRYKYRKRSHRYGYKKYGASYAYQSYAEAKEAAEEEVNPETEQENREAPEEEPKEAT